MVGCELCGSGENLLRCAKCKCVYYCSKEHQIQHWRVHKRLCKKGRQPVDQRQQGGAQQIQDQQQLAAVSSSSSTYPVDKPCHEWFADNVSQTWPLHLGPGQNGSSGGQNSDQEDIGHNGFAHLATATSPEPWESSSSSSPSSYQHQPGHRRTQDTGLRTVRVDTGSPSSPYHQTGLTTDEEMANGAGGRATMQTMCQNVIRDMNEYGICVIDDFAGEKVGNAVFQEVVDLYNNSGRFVDGKLMTDMAGSSSRTIRGDKIAWVDGLEPGCRNIGSLIRLVDSVVIRSNKLDADGELGQCAISDRTRAMVACYPGGGTQYVKHVDNPNKDGRCITCIYYLNKDWDARRDGGLLRIFPKGRTTTVADIEPSFDRILLFWSDRRNPHEVQPALRTRYAITLWYYDKYEKENSRVTNTADVCRDRREQEDEEA